MSNASEIPLSLYPIIVRQARYSGIYEGGLWLASSNCDAIPLGNGESCNLATIFLPNVDSLEQMHEISQLLYMAQKQITRLTYPYKKTTEIVQKNARLGQSITGILQVTEGKLTWLDPVYSGLVAFDKKYSAIHGFPVSVRLTTVQPSGTLSLLPGVTPGIHPAYAQYYTRRVRQGWERNNHQTLRYRG